LDNDYFLQPGSDKYPISNTQYSIANTLPNEKQSPVARQPVASSVSSGFQYRQPGEELKTDERTNPAQRVSQKKNFIFNEYIVQTIRITVN